LFYPQKVSFPSFFLRGFKAELPQSFPDIRLFLPSISCGISFLSGEEFKTMLFRKFQFLSTVFVSFFCVFCVRNSFANEVMLETLQKQMREMQQMIQTLQITVQTQNEVIQRQTFRIEKLEEGGAIPQNIPVPQTLASVTPGAPRLVGISQGFNPEIGVVGSIEAQLTQNTEDAEGKDTIAVKELELNFAHYVDPYSRFDATITFNDALEEQNVKADIYFVSSPKRDIHFFSPTPKDVLKVKKADVFIHGGLDLEMWRGPLLDAAGKREFINGERTIDVSQGIALLEIPTSLSRVQGDIHAFGNTHYWLDPRNGKIIANNIAEGLARIDPEEADFFKKNARDFNRCHLSQ
jgi:hypothetical protein